MRVSADVDDSGVEEPGAQLTVAGLQELDERNPYLVVTSPGSLGHLNFTHYLASRPLFLETNPKTLEEEASAAASLLMFD